MIMMNMSVIVLILFVCSFDLYSNCRCISAASAPMAPLPPSRIVAMVTSGDKRCHVSPTAACNDDVAADGDGGIAAGRSSSVTEIIDTIVQKVVSIRGGGKVEV